MLLTVQAIAEKTGRPERTVRWYCKRLGLVPVHGYQLTAAQAKALVAALKEGILAGVGLDVLEEEGATKSGSESSKATGTPEAMHVMLHNHELMHMQNVLITPHNAFNTQEALERILETTFENIRGFMSGTPVNVVSESS